MMAEFEKYLAEEDVGNMVVAFIWLENGKINCEMKAYWEK